MQTKYIVLVIVVIAVTAGGYFLVQQNQETAPTTQISIPENTGVAEITEINVTGTEFNFEPAAISVKAGERVKITFQNNGFAPHNVMIEGLNIGTKIINGGQTDTTVEFTAPAAGTYVFFCSVPGHRALGMEGNLKVE